MFSHIWVCSCGVCVCFQELDELDEASGLDNFMNLKLDGVEVAFAEGESISKWKLPPVGGLTFDYVATKRVPKEAKAQRQEVGHTFMELPYHEHGVPRHCVARHTHIRIACSRRACATCPQVFLSFRKELSNPALSEATKLLMLRTAATTHYWSSAQVRELVALISFPRRVDAVVMLFRRTVDLDQQFYACATTRLPPPPPPRAPP